MPCEAKVFNDNYYKGTLIKMCVQHCRQGNIFYKLKLCIYYDDDDHF